MDDPAIHHWVGPRQVRGLSLAPTVWQNQIHTNILIVQSCQKSYTDKRRRPFEFEVGDHVYLWFSPMKGVHRFGIKGKLNSCYISLYPIIDKYEPLSYQVDLPLKLSGVHNVFHVSQHKKCLKAPTDVVIEDTIPLEPDLTYKAYPVKKLEQQDQQILQGSMELSFRRLSHVRMWRFPMIQLSGVSSTKVKIRTSPCIFSLLKFQDEISFKGGGL
jgi:hypothetical protein